MSPPAPYPTNPINQAITRITAIKYSSELIVVFIISEKTSFLNTGKKVGESAKLLRNIVLIGCPEILQLQVGNYVMIFSKPGIIFVYPHHIHPAKDTEYYSMKGMENE